MNSPVIVVLTCVYQRRELAEIVLRTYQRLAQRLKGDVTLQLLAIGSEGDASRELCERSGFDYIEYANSPLTHKWNHGVRASRRYDPDALVIVGSDDLISEDLIRVYAEKLKDGHDFLGLTDFYFFDIATSRLGYWPGYEATDPERAHEPVGCGRCFSRRLLEQTDWNLWPEEPRLDREIDKLAREYLASRGFEPVSWKLADIGASAVDMKSITNINAFDEIDYQHVAHGVPATLYLRSVLEESELDDLLRLQGNTRVPARAPGE
jgi:hypothetical protein